MVSDNLKKKCNEKMFGVSVQMGHHFRRYRDLSCFVRNRQFRKFQQYLAIELLRLLFSLYFLLPLYVRHTSELLFFPINNNQIWCDQTIVSYI